MWMKAGDLAALREQRVVTVSHGGRTVAVFAENGTLFAVDNRCPHMGFPLSKGTLKNGILTCHWHSWQFDASCGGCFTRGGSPVQPFRAEVRGAEVWVDFPEATPEQTVARWRADLDTGIAQFSTLRLAKAVYTLLSNDVAAEDIVARGAAFGTTYRDDFGDGLSTLTAMANVVRNVELPVEARTLALVHGLRRVAQNIESTPHRRVKGGLPGTRATYEKLVEWFRMFVHDREEEAAERVLTSVIRDGAPRATISSAATSFESSV